MGGGCRNGNRKGEENDDGARACRATGRGAAEGLSGRALRAGFQDAAAALWWRRFSPRSARTSASIWSRRNFSRAIVPPPPTRKRSRQNWKARFVRPVSFGARPKAFEQRRRRSWKNIAARCRRRWRSCTRFPASGRKTANVVLGNAFGKDEGIVVDTHVARLSHRLGLTKQTDAEKIEADLMKIVPRAHWTVWSHWLIWHGRRRCFARRPDCRRCEILPALPERTEVHSERRSAGAREIGIVIVDYAASAHSFSARRCARYGGGKPTRDNASGSAGGATECSPAWSASGTPGSAVGRGRQIPVGGDGKSTRRSGAVSEFPSPRSKGWFSPVREPGASLCFAPGFIPSRPFRGLPCAHRIRLSRDGIF